MYEMIINGRKKTVDVDDDTPLLWVIREEVGYTGTKFGCGAGLCGACTVHMDGAPIRSCQMPIGAVASAKITTIEGLAKEDGTLHPVQQAWCELSVPQCGYCQSGQIMSAVALLKTNKTPSDADIDDAMSGNLCRCGTYPRIKQAIHLAAKKMAK